MTVQLNCRWWSRWEKVTDLIWAVWKWLNSPRFISNKRSQTINEHGGKQHGKQKHWSVHLVNSWVTTFRDQSQAQTKCCGWWNDKRKDVGQSGQKYNTGNGAICCPGYCGKKCLQTVLITCGIYMTYPPIAFALFFGIIGSWKGGVSMRPKEKLWNFWRKG